MPTESIPMNFLPSAMKPSRGIPPLLVLLLLTFFLPLGPRASERDTRAGAEAATTTAATPPPATGEALPAPPPAEAAPPPAGCGQADDREAFRTLKQRYRQDPTGVRARLGMCRRGQDDHGGWRHRHRHGGEQWQNP